MDVPADGGSATPPCNSLGGRPPDADDEGAIARRTHQSSMTKKHCDDALPVMENIKREIGKSAFWMTMMDSEARATLQPGGKKHDNEYTSTCWYISTEL